LTFSRDASSGIMGGNRFVSRCVGFIGGLINGCVVSERPCSDSRLPKIFPEGIE